MHSIYAVSCKHSFNGYATFDTNSSQFSSSCAFCHSCPLSTHTLRLNRLTQSSLLQFSPSRRFVFRAEVPYTLVRTSYHLNCPTNTTRRSRIKEQRFCSHDDSEIILSFLSEETDKDASANVSSSKRMEIKTKKKGNLKQHKASSIDRTRECEKPDTEWEALTKGENSRKQRDMSSCSSYYTLSSRDSETDLELQHNMGLEEFSLGYDKSEANHMEGQVKEEFNRQKDDSEKVHSVSNK